MNFKECVQDDIKNVFLNIDELAEMHEIDKREMPCIVDDDLLQQQSIKSATGTHKGKKLIHVAQDDFKGKIPALNSTISFDSSPYIVSDIIKNDGVLTILLDKNRA